MRTIKHELGTVYVPGENDSLDKLYKLRQTQKIWAADTETTGLRMFARDRLRIAQVGTKNEAWILRPEWHKKAIIDLTKDAWWHHLTFDALFLQESLGVPFEATAIGADDTEVRSRLLDPRGPEKGGIGHKLEQAAAHYLKLPGLKKDARSHIVEACRKLKIKAADIWRDCPIDLHEYLLYAGQDVFLTARLAEVMIEKTKERGLQKFVDFELPFSRRIAKMQIKGIRFDHEWANKAETHFDELFTESEAVLLKKWDINQTTMYAHTSKQSLIKRFKELGVGEWPKYTSGGKKGIPQESLDKDVLQSFVVSGGAEISALARAVFTAKRNKHYGDYIRGMRNNLGSDGRVHPNTRPMQAATARMSISDPPLQQLPRGDKLIRGCLIADPGHEILCVDYAQIEFRVGAAISQDPEMIRMIKAGEDLHHIAASSIYGPGYTSEQRNICKGIGFGWLYMGRPKGVLAQLMESYPEDAPSIAAVTKAMKSLDNKFPVMKRWGTREMYRIKNGRSTIITATGRPLIVDVPWAAVNYYVQSAARDIFATGINKGHAAGLGDYMRLVVHDELVNSVPKRSTKKLMTAFQKAMECTFKGVPILTEAEVKGERWSK